MTGAENSRLDFVAFRHRIQRLVESLVALRDVPPPERPGEEERVELTLESTGIREAGLPVIVLPCDAILTKWFGESERRLAEVFGLCRQAGRMILLIDELDALARHRQDSYETTARLVQPRQRLDVS